MSLLAQHIADNFLHLVINFNAKELNHDIHDRQTLTFALLPAQTLIHGPTAKLLLVNPHSSTDEPPLHHQKTRIAFVLTINGGTLYDVVCVKINQFLTAAVAFLCNSTTTRSVEGGHTAALLKPLRQYDLGAWPNKVSFYCVAITADRKQFLALLRNRNRGNKSDLHFYIKASITGEFFA